MNHYPELTYSPAAMLLMVLCIVVVLVIVLVLEAKRQHEMRLAEMIEECAYQKQQMALREKADQERRVKWKAFENQRRGQA
jgi:predicted Holliday junction resolvase-like endonuclease